MQDMQQGGNAPIGSARPRIAFAWTPPGGRGVEADVSAYLLTATGKVRGDHDMVFYNQPDGGAGAVRFRADGGGTFDMDLEALPVDIDRIVFCLTIDEAQAKGHTLALIDGAEIVVSDGDAAILRFRPILTNATEAAMIFGELYRRAGWAEVDLGNGLLVLEDTKTGRSVRPFTPAEADQLRRAMATFKFTGGVSHFSDKLVEGMVDRG